ncbi:GPI-anchored protein [Actinidia chinensis var. chinensis]|uniref:GPI-anchored protein n=1 Tax=Actinidia chinensis var. chinensis TaxID=1590841 RepID=A0A2R6RV19_ACTCC|nr:GPI-anchored protein [Actinidia chinensis var. chinensis]
MACLRLRTLVSLLLLSILSINRTAKCDDEEENLLRGINSYRASLNLTALTKNENAECLAEQMADQFKNQPCTNTTGSNTVPGTEPVFSKYPNFLAKCHLNLTTTQDGQILPACVPNLVPSLVLTNFTQSQYSKYLNDTKFTGAGISSEDNWIVVVLTANTSGGSFVNDKSAGLVSTFGLIYYCLFLVMSFFLLAS